MKYFLRLRDESLRENRENGFGANLFYVLCCVILFFVLFLYEKIKMFDYIETGSFSVILIILVMVGIATSVILKENRLNTNLIGKCFLLFLLPVYTLSLMYSLFNPFDSIVRYVMIIMPLLLFMTGYFITLNLNDHAIVFLSAYVVFGCLIAYFVMNYSNSIYYDITRQSASTYSILYMMPFVFCIKKRNIQYFTILLMFVILMMSLKRGGFVAFCLGTTLYLVSLHLRNMNLNKILVVVPVACFLIYAGFWLFEYMDSVTGNLMSARFSDDETGSGRTNIYLDAVSMIMGSSWNEILFGHGWNSFRTMYWGHLPVHNDFLEIVYDHGFYCAIMYLFFWGALLSYAMKMSRLNSFFAPAMWFSLGVFFVNSTVSHIFLEEKHFIIFGLFWGCVSAAFEKESYQNVFLIKKL